MSTGEFQSIVVGMLLVFVDFPEASDLMWDWGFGRSEAIDSEAEFNANILLEGEFSSWSEADRDTVVCFRMEASCRAQGIKAPHSSTHADFSGDEGFPDFGVS